MKRGHSTRQGKTYQAQKGWKTSLFEALRTWDSASVESHVSQFGLSQEAI